MAEIVIRKKVTLDFLGEDYKNDYLTFRSMPLKTYSELLPKLDKAKDDGLKSIELIKSVLQEHFLEGSFQNQPVTKENLDEFDIVTLTNCFEVFTGQASDPKVAS